MPADPAERFDGTILIVAPHMDDDVLACGGLIARLPDKRKVHIVYATDGMKSPSPVIPWRDSIKPDLGEIRMRESEAAADLLGVPKENLRFLGLPDGGLQAHLPELRRLLIEHVRRLDPGHVLIPFRYDRHPDHLAINQVITAAHREGLDRTVLTEYFIYHRWRLLPQRDVRKYIRPECLFEIDIDRVASLKRASLACYTSQTTRFYPWQTRPILTGQLLDEECEGTEIFLRVGPSVKGSTVFSRAVLWIRIVHRLEPFLQKWKYLIKSTLVRGSRSEDGVGN